MTGMRARFALFALALALCASTPSFAGAPVAPSASAEPAVPAPTVTPEPPMAQDDGAVTEVKVDRVRPMRPKHPTLRFLRENRDFLRARLDLLRATRSEHPGATDALDPRWLTYQTILSGAGAGHDSVTATDERQARRTLLTHIGELSDLEQELDGMDRVLDAQAGRLTALDADFAGQQQTALVLLLKGHPAEGAPAALTIAFEDSTVLDITLTPEQRSALANGGIAELHHGFIEPREQVMELSVARGTAAELAERFAAPPKGEITLVLGPGRREVDETGALAAVAELVESGVPRKRAAEVVARLTGVARNRLYRGSL